MEKKIVMSFSPKETSLETVFPSYAMAGANLQKKIGEELNIADPSPELAQAAISEFAIFSLSMTTELRE